jgi:hypothetical protein
VILAVSTWVFGGSTAGTAPFYLLMAVWVGMHFSVRAVLALSPFVAASYLVPLSVVDRGPMTVTGAVTFVPALVGVGVLIARQVEHQRRDRETIRRMERWRAALSATLAHDVRSPLTSVQFALETLDEDGDLPAEQRHSVISVALRQTSRIRRLAAGLLDADRLDSHGGLRLDLSTLPLRAVVEEAVGYLNTPVRVEVPDGLTVRADPQRLEQMLVNLTAPACPRTSAPCCSPASAAPTPVPARSAWACGSPGSWPARTAATPSTPRPSPAAASPSPCPPDSAVRPGPRASAGVRAGAGPAPAGRPRPCSQASTASRRAARERRSAARVVSGSR